MKRNNYLNEISNIKQLMETSSRFLSLSGLSGVLAGIYAIIGAYLMYTYPAFNSALVMASVALLSICSSMILSVKKAKKNNEKVWNVSSKNFIFSLALPLFTGGAYLLTEVYHQRLENVVALMLIFYGLALVNASKYTHGMIKYLGIINIILGLICTFCAPYSLWFWVVGFGLMHIIYGTWMHLKYEKSK